MADDITLAPYDPAWPTIFAREATLLRTALPDGILAGIEHIGSTAVPGLGAKPIVDIALGLRAGALTPPHDFWEQLGYEPGHPEEHSTEWLYYVKRRSFGERIIHLHVVAYGGMHWQKWLRFRDRLRADPSLAREYLDLKRELAKRYRDDRLRYTFEKAPFVARAIAPWRADLEDVALRAAKPGDRAFVERIYFQTQRWIIETLFGWRGDDIERGKFDEHYALDSTAIITFEGQDIGWITILREADRLELDGIYLAEAHQRMGIGTFLIGRLIEEAALANVPVTLSTAKINPARSLYERLGFHIVAESEFKVFFERPADTACILREEIRADIDAIRAVHSAAFDRAAEGLLVDRLRDDGLVVTSLVAIAGGRCVGNVVFSNLTIRSVDGDVPAAALAPVAVAPDHQGRGIGSKLITSGLERCKSLELKVVLVLGRPAYYSRFGFSAELAKRIEGPYSGEAWMAMELRQDALPNGTLSVVYPSAFDAVD